jgi:hypothetical protein
MHNFVTVMMAVCFLVVPYICLRFGMERRSWRAPLILIVAAGITTPSVTAAWSYMRWRRERREFLTNPPPISIREEVRGEDKQWVRGTIRDGKAEYVTPDGGVLRVPPPAWEPIRSYEVRPDQCAILAGVVVTLGAVGYGAGRLIAQRRTARARPTVAS